ncbi:MAG: LamG domain-containing protein [Thermoanaerobaculia bacterium]
MISQRPRVSRGVLTRSWLAAAALLLAGAAPTLAQPFGVWVNTSGPTQTGRISIPHSAALNPTTATTVEAWVLFNSEVAGEDCRSIAGKDYTAAWWIGRCGGQLRSYFRGGGSAHTGGVIPLHQWTHVAATTDGSRVKHYINGELVLDQPAGGSPTTSTAEMRISSDVSWEHPPSGSLDEIRLWSVARTEAQIRSTLNVRVNSAMTGLVGVWPLEANANDIIGGHNGAVVGTGVVFFTSPVTLTCGASTSTSLCLNGHFAVSARFRTGAPGTAESQAHTVNCPNPGSGLFYFFAPDNWEVMVKLIDGCGLNSRFWLFSAATTNVFYRMEVTDVRAGENKVYFNYPGPPAPAVTDVSAFATCP